MLPGIFLIHTLSRLKYIINKYSGLSSQETSIYGKLKTAWKRLSMEQEDVCEIRSGIDANITLLARQTRRLARNITVKLVRYQENNEKQVIHEGLTPASYAPQHNSFQGTCGLHVGEYVSSHAR